MPAGLRRFRRAVGRREEERGLRVDNTHGFWRYTDGFDRVHRRRHARRFLLVDDEWAAAVVRVGRLGRVGRRRTRRILGLRRRLRKSRQEMLVALVFDLQNAETDTRKSTFIHKKTMNEKRTHNNGLEKPYDTKTIIL